MADYFQSQPNFTNPQYASPEQLAQQRAYAEALTKRSGENVNRPTGALANMITALTAGLERNRANEIQSQAAGQNAGDVSSLIAQLKGGQGIDPQTAGRVYANPMASPEHRALIGALVTPKVGEDVAGRPANISSLGANAIPLRGYEPGIRTGVSSEGNSVTAAPMPAAPFAGQPRPAPKLDAVSPQGGAFGGMNSQPIGSGPVQPPTAPPATFDARFGSLPPQAVGMMQQLAGVGRDIAAKKAFTQGGAEALTTIAKQDIEGATSAPTIKRVAGVMLDDLAKHGDKMTFGPTAEWSNNVKRIAANYAPGFMKDQLEAVASADSFDKMSAQLTSLLARGGGTDAQLFNNMKSVPGAHNSKEGAEALLKMTLQVADQQMALRQFTAPAKDASQYEAMRGDFYKRNPIINPLTNNPIALDLEKSKSAGGAKIISVRPSQ